MAMELRNMENSKTKWKKRGWNEWHFGDPTYTHDQTSGYNITKLDNLERQ